MIKKIAIYSMIGLSALGLSAASLAGGATTVDSTPSIASGFYAQALIGYGKTNYRVGNFDNDGFMYNINGGYKFSPNLAAEAGFTGMPKVKASGTTVANYNYIVDIAAKGILPITHKVNVYGKLGVAAVHSKFSSSSLNTTTGNQTKVALYTAVGAGYEVTRHVEVDVQGSLTTAAHPIPAMYGVTAGVAYQF